MTSEGARLKAHLKLVGAAKAETRREDIEAHFALPVGKRLERAAELSDALFELWRGRGRPGESSELAEADKAWRRVYETLQRTARRG